MLGRTSGATAPDIKNCSQALRKAFARSSGSARESWVESVGDTTTTPGRRW